MTTGTNIEVPDKFEYIRRKKLLEKHFLEHTCHVHNLDREKAQFALEEGILNLEPSFFDWEHEEWAKESIQWTEGFNIASIAKKSELIKIPDGKSVIVKLAERMHLPEFTQRVLNSLTH
ncbi:MAG: hypothetical protein MK132_17715 [Lentisphaerales bacterium]|nr:hypothetical protein [Lentisphaerales bacterium]